MNDARQGTIMPAIPDVTLKCWLASGAIVPPSGWRPVNRARAWIYVGLFLTLVMAAFLTAAGVRADSQSPLRLSGKVDGSWIEKAHQAIDRGDRLIEVESAWRTYGNEWTSGGSYVVGLIVAHDLKVAGITARCVGLCGSAAAMVVIGSGSCVVTKQGFLILHAAIAPQEWGKDNAEKIKQASLQWMRANHIPDDLVQRAEWAWPQAYTLNDWQMKRVGCRLE